MASAAAQPAEPQLVTPLKIEAIFENRAPGKVAWKGDLPGMRERRLIRVLVPNNRTFFFYDGLQPRGLAHELMTEFVNALNAGKSTNAPAPVRGLDHCTGAAGSGASSSA